jgi:hypothetical protein
MISEAAVRRSMYTYPGTIASTGVYGISGNRGRDQYHIADGLSWKTTQGVSPFLAFYFICIFLPKIRVLGFVDALDTYYGAARDAHISDGVGLIIQL